MSAGLFTHGFGLLRQEREVELKLYGNVDIRQVELGFRVGGRIVGMAFNEGERVPAGAVLATLDAARSAMGWLAGERAESRVAEADLAKHATATARRISPGRSPTERQQGALDQGPADYHRRAALVSSDAVSRGGFDLRARPSSTAQADAAAAEAALSLQRAGARQEDIAAVEARLASAPAQRDKASTDLADTSLLAPNAGIILTRAREPGAIVQPGETVYTLTIDRPMRFRA